MKSRFVIHSKTQLLRSYHNRFPVADEAYDLALEGGSGRQLISFFDDAGVDGESASGALDRFIENWTPALGNLAPEFVEMLQLEWVVYLTGNVNAEMMSLTPDQLDVLSVLKVTPLVAQESPELDDGSGVLLIREVFDRPDNSVFGARTSITQCDSKRELRMCS